MRYFQVLCHELDGESSHRVWHLENETGVLSKEFNDEVVVYLKDAEDMSRREYVYVNVIAHDNYIKHAEIQKIVNKSLQYWDISKDIEIEEIKETALIDTCFFPMPSEMQKIARLIPCDEICDLIKGYKKSVKEITASTLSKEECQKLICNTPWSESMHTEIDRIFSIQKVQKSKQQAESRIIQNVYYMFDNADDHHLHLALKALTSAKIATNSLLSSRIFEIDLDMMETNEPVLIHYKGMRDVFTDSLGYELSGNTVVLKYGKEEAFGKYDLDAYKRFSRMLEILKPYILDTLVIIAIPNRNSELEARIKKMLDLPVVKVQSNFIDTKALTKCEVMNGFKLRAEREGVKLNKKLEKMFDAEKSAQSMILPNAIYERWRAIELKNDVYGVEFDEFDASRQLDTTDKSAMQRLDELIGLDSVKKQIKQIIACANMDAVSRSHGIEPQERTLHLAFKGAPGTGKTEVAKLYAQILKEAGILTSGTLVVKNGAGWDIEKGFEEAKGGVLFIDEAYALIGYTDAITTLIANMETYRREVVVILAGYKPHIDALIRRNPGFKSRIGFEIEFDDYTTDELVQIFMLMCNRADFILDDDVKDEVRNIICRAGRRSDQGNGRFVRKFFEDVCLNKDCRLNELRANNLKHIFTKIEILTIAKEDVLATRESEGTEDAWNELENMIGLKNVKAQVKKIITFNKMQKLRRKRGLDSAFVPMHMAFTGNPGTGKTEVARLIGKIMAQEGLLSVGDFKECGKADLVHPLPGCSAAMVDNLFERSLGGVIFIDEAYSLINAGTGNEQEAVSALIANMENHREEVVVIFAGYNEDMDNLFKSNAGFASRVKTRLHFDDYSANELAEIFKLMASKKDFVLGAGTKEKLMTVFESAAKSKDNGAGRLARNILDETLMSQSLRISELLETGKNLSDKELQTIMPEDISVPDEVVKEEHAAFGFLAKRSA